MKNKQYLNGFIKKITIIILLLLYEGLCEKLTLKLNDRIGTFADSSLLHHLLFSATIKNGSNNVMFPGVNGHNGHNTDTPGFSEGDLLLQV